MTLVSCSCENLHVGNTVVMVHKKIEEHKNSGRTLAATVPKSIQKSMFCHITLFSCHSSHFFVKSFLMFCMSFGLKVSILLPSHFSMKLRTKKPQSDLASCEVKKCKVIHCVIDAYRGKQIMETNVLYKLQSMDLS